MLPLSKIRNRLMIELDWIVEFSILIRMNSLNKKVSSYLQLNPFIQETSIIKLTQSGRGRGIKVCNGISPTAVRYHISKIWDCNFPILVELNWSLEKNYCKLPAWLCSLPRIAGLPVRTHSFWKSYKREHVRDNSKKLDWEIKVEIKPCPAEYTRISKS